MYVKVIEESEVEPIELITTKLWMKVDFANDNFLIEALIKSTRQLLEQYTCLSFIPKTLEVIMDITKTTEIPYSPLVNMLSVQRREYNTWVDCVENIDYWIIGDSIEVNIPAMYKMEYEAGYEMGTLPEPLITDMKVLVSWQYENRGIKFRDSVDTLNYPFMHLLNARNYRKIVI